MPIDRKAIPSQRANISDQWIPAFFAETQKVLARHYKQAIEVIVDEGISTLRHETRPRMVDEIKDATRLFYYAMAQDGYDLAGLEVGDINRTGGKSLQFGKAIPDIDPALMSLRVRRSVDAFLKETAPNISATMIKHISKKYEKLRADDRVLTGREIARELEDHFSDMDRTQAERIVRSGTIWSYNDGAVERYQEAGITEKQWYTTDDDLLCDFCEPMDGRTITVKGEYFEKGQSIPQKEGPPMQAMFSVGHPPLHPNCRCAIIPVV